MEFALIMPLLLMLVLGIVEFGWLMSQNNNIRHGAREAGRLAAVNAADVATMGAEACNSMDLAPDATVAFTDTPAGAVGDRATVAVAMPVRGLTGFPLLTAMLPPTLRSTVEVRLEQPSAAWSTGTHAC